MWKPGFKFSRGPITGQVTSKRMNHILDGVEMAQPASSGHKGILIRQTPNGWMASVQQAIKKVVQYADNPWQLYQADDDDPGLVISMLPGVVQYTSSATGNPLTVFVNMTPFTLTDDATTKIYLKASIASSTYGDYYKLWAVTSLSVESGSSIPSDTLNISTDTDGDIYIEIGEVTTDTGEIDSITQVLASSVPIVFPLTLTGPSTGTYVLVSEDGAIEWVEADPDPVCPSEVT